ncbi:MAG TPA: hypothetical protein VKU00_25085, partial [Chthonomonadaceae bacterium]|nr:hypothetical protein [Chthonomonadaceae bacterium]
MQCRFARERMREMAGERGIVPGRLALAVRWHLLGCASCRREWQRLQKLLLLARNLPAPALPSALKARVLAEIAADPLPLPTTKGPYLMRTSMLVSAVTICLVAVFLIWPHTHGRVNLAEADVKQALQSVNTWHLSGWKMKNGEQVPWEIWGRRKPFFYRESFGGEEIWDDGTTRMQLLPAAPKRMQGPSIALCIPSRMGPESIGWNFLPGPINSWNRWALPAQDAKERTYSVAQSDISLAKPLRQTDLLTFSNDSVLPIRYEQMTRQYLKATPGPEPDPAAPQESNLEKQWVSVHLDAQYDMPLPPEVERPLQSPAGYPILDATGPVTDPDITRECALTQHGFTVQALPVQMDRNGNVALVVSAWLGNQSLSKHPLPLLFSVKPFDGTHSYRLNVMSEPAQGKANPLLEGASQPTAYK